MMTDNEKWDPRISLGGKAGIFWNTNFLIGKAIEYFDVYKHMSI